VTDCQTCPHYAKGRGDEACLSCEAIRALFIARKGVERRVVCVGAMIDDMPGNEAGTCDLLTRLRDLPPAIAAVAVLRAYLGLSIAETAGTLGISSSSVSRRYSAAVRALRAGE